MPGITVTINDGALGALPSSVGVGRAKVGTCLLGTPGTIYPINSQEDIKTNLGIGPLAEACSYELAIAGAPIYAAVASATAGSISTVTAVGTSPTLTVSASTPKAAYDMRITITTGAALSTGTVYFTIGYDNGTANDGGPTTVSAPIGITGTSPVTYNVLDAVTGLSTGIVLTFSSGTYVTGDYYTFRTSAPYMSVGAMQTAVRALAASNYIFRLVHCVGCDNSLSSTNSTLIGNGLTLAAAFDTELVTMASATGAAKRFVRGFAEMPDNVTTIAKTATDWAAWDTSAASQSASVTTVRTAIGSGHYGAPSTLNGVVVRKNAAHFYAAEAGAYMVQDLEQVDPAEVRRGPVVGIIGSGIYRDETRTSTKLDDSRFLTIGSLTINRSQQPYFKRSPTFTSPSSDYALYPRGAVMDTFAKAMLEASLLYQNAAVRVNPDGTIFETDAREIETAITSYLSSVLPYTGPVPKISPPTSDTPIVQVDRTNNVLSTNTVKIKGRITPLGYISTIVLDLGFNAVAIVAGSKGA